MSQPQEQLLPKRVLVVDDDEIVRDSVAALVRAADIEVLCASDGQEAITMMGRQWFPVIVTDRQMPVLDGLELVSRLRAISVAPVYVIMLTAITDAHECERGYCAGVDLYIAKNGHERELAARVTAAFSAVRRRQVSQVTTADVPVTVDLETGAHTARHLVGRLHAEIAYAARVNKSLHVLTVCIQPSDQHARRSGAIGAASDGLLEAVHGAVRPKLDWVARLPGARESCRLAVVMPESDATHIAAVEQGVRNAFVKYADDPALRGMSLSFGAAALSDAGDQPTALGLLAESERKRRGLQAKASAVAAVKSVQEEAE